MALKGLNRLSRGSVIPGNYLDEILRHNPLDYRDKAFVSHLVQGVLRWRIKLDWIIEQSVSFAFKKISPSVLNILRLAVYQIFFLDRVPESAAVNEAVKQAKLNNHRQVVSSVNGILRNICRQKDKIIYPDPARKPFDYLSVYYSYPKWLVKKWAKEFGPEFTEDLLSAGNRIPALCIRTNILKIDRPALIKLLTGEGVKADPAPYLPCGILINGLRRKVDKLDSFKKGLFQVQGQAAQIASYLLAPQSDEVVLDICAGLGGKTTHLAEYMGNRGKMLALDISIQRLLILKNNSKRLGTSSITSLSADASRSLSSLFRVKFDKIIVDAPCSGLGVISRHPDGKWNKNDEDIGRLAFLQKAILNEAVSVLRRGGRILYMTCTISEEENEGVVNSCVASNKDLYLEDLRDYIPAWGGGLIDDRGFLKTFPHIHNMDGFFGALLRKE